jgi:anti-sigma-K factor RskA
MSVGSEHSGGPEDDRVLVAEYALGLLDGRERVVMAHRIETEPQLSDEMRMWQDRLSSLDGEFADTAPPAGTFGKIEHRLWGVADKPAGWWNSLILWRWATSVAAAVAVVALGLNVMLPRPDAQALATQLVAALQANEGSGVEFVAFYDQVSGAVRITSLSGEAFSDKDYELWYIKGDAPAVSMGVLPINEKREIPLDAAAKAGIEAGTTLAVTLETKGGSPTGVAQGPIVAVGKVTPI